MEDAERSRRWYKKNKAKKAEYDQNWRKENKAKMVEYGRKRRAKMTESERQYHVEYKRIWREQNKAKLTEYSRRRRARVAGARGTHTIAQWEALLAHYGGCVHPDKDKCSGIITEDHIIPFSKGGTDTISNIQPLCFHHNISKGTKTIDYRPDK